MERLRALFSKHNLPKFVLFAAIYIVGRMEGEGRFQWGKVFAAAWQQAVTVGAAALDSARGIVGM